MAPRRGSALDLGGSCRTCACKAAKPARPAAIAPRAKGNWQLATAAAKALTVRARLRGMPRAAMSSGGRAASCCGVGNNRSTAGKGVTTAVPKAATSRPAS